MTLLDHTLFNSEFWRYLSIPVVAALVGWSTNWVAIKLTFWPTRFIGIKPWLGWQGIIPRKAAKMAQISVEKSLSRLGSIGDLLERIGPEVVIDHLVEYADARIEEKVDEVMMSEFAPVWSQAPEPIKQRVYMEVRQRIPYTLEEIVFDALDSLDDIFDLEEMAVRSLVANPDILNRMFLEAGRKELQFIIRSGLFFGGLFGLIQLVVWFIAPDYWVLPTFGFIVGFATNWLALNIIFRPLHPVKIGPWTIQGMFLRRQEEVAERYSYILAHELLTPEHIMDTIMTGSKAEGAQRLIDEQVRNYMQEVNIPEDMVKAFLGEDAIERLTAAMSRLFRRDAKDPFVVPEFQEARAKEATELLAGRMKALSSEEFQDVLRPAFQEDEWVLIMVGAGLGLLAGLAQLFFVFGLESIQLI